MSNVNLNLRAKSSDNLNYRCYVKVLLRIKTTFSSENIHILQNILDAITE